MDTNRDENFVPCALLVLNTDGKTLVRFCINPVNKGACVSDGTTGSDLGPTVAATDGNFVRTLCAVSWVDGKTLVPLYGTSSGSILIQST